MITKPTLLIDEAKCKRNIEAMFAKAQSNKLEFRPHFKTHQSLEIGEWFKELGVTKITVSSVSMAEYFSSNWHDITIAFPVNILEIGAINTLAEKVKLNLLIENEESLRFLNENLINNVGVFLKIDVGYHRTGIDSKNLKVINSLLDVLDDSTLLNFIGFLGHAGHTYNCRTNDAIKKIHADSIKKMSYLRKKYSSRSPNLLISLGDTPGCSVADNFSGIDEIRPGNFVFYDLMQNKIGANTISQIAVAMACPIVAIHSDRSEIVVYGGGVHFSKERLEDTEGTIFGRVVEKTAKGWGNIIQGMYVKSLSQEHGIITAPKSQVGNYAVGDYLIVLPIHSCMTANLMKSYLNNNKVIKMR